MLTFATRNRKRHLLAAFAVAAALAAVLTVTSPAKAYGGSPVGHVDGIVYYPSVLLPVVQGWAVDPDTLTSPIYVRADVTWTKKTCNRLFGCITYAVGQTSATQLANIYWPDIADKYPSDAEHGFSITLALPSLPTASYNGAQVCVTALNVWLGTNTTLGCDAFAYPFLPYSY